MTDDELKEVSSIITDALFTFRAPVDGDRRLARGRHIADALEAKGWHLVKEEE